jgi:hypothetical protein
MAKQVIISTPKGAVNGTPLDEAFTMCNENFTELYGSQGAPKFTANTVLIGQGADNDAVDSSKTTTNFMQIPYSNGRPTSNGGARAGGAMYWELGLDSGIEKGLYVSIGSGDDFAWGKVTIVIEPKGIDEPIVVEPIK